MKIKLLLPAFLILSFGFFAQTKTTEKKSGTKTFASSCKPVADVGGHSGTSKISLKELDELNAIAVSNCGAKGDYKILSYECTSFIKGNPVVFSGKNEGVFLGTQKSLFVNMKPGNKIFFDNIKVKGPDGKIRTAEGIILIVE